LSTPDEHSYDVDSEDFSAAIGAPHEKVAFILLHSDSMMSKEKKSADRMRNARKKVAKSLQRDIKQKLEYKHLYHVYKLRCEESEKVLKRYDTKIEHHDVQYQTLETQRSIAKDIDLGRTSLYAS